MGEIEFVNDLRCNYLTIPYRGEEGDFAVRMMTENVTDAFLTVELRRLDGQTFLYYRISGMQNMEILYAEKQIDRKVFRTFMWQLHEAIEQSRELFLAGDGICLEPSSLFWDLGEERWKFIYIPGRDERKSEEVQSEREKLAEFLMTHMDYEDRELTEIIYRFYEEICEGKIIPDFWKKKVVSEKMWEIPQEEKTEKTEEFDGDAAEDWNYEDSEEKGEEGEVREGSTHGGKKILVLLCVFLCAAAVVTLAAGRVMQEMIIVGAGTTALLAAVLFVALVRRRNKKEKEENKPEDIIYEEPENIYGIEEERNGGHGGEYQAEEKTVYMDLQREQERKLYGIGKFRRQRILLATLPCLVGKDKTLVNHIIADTSVSRIHAKFFAEQEMIWMQDLNSTNGTYHNGMRLNPNERVKLEPEDEIGFGQVQFIFR